MRAAEIRFLSPPDLLDAVGCVRDYRDTALASELPHGPSHDCLICADGREALGYLPMEPVLAEAARFMREHDDGVTRIGTAGGGAAC